jgi:predicted lipopolysaccharide heptosyltransferase III
MAGTRTQIGHGNRQELQGIESVLVLRLEHAGDVLLATPLFRALREKFPSARITAAIGSWAVEILDGNTQIDETIVFDHPLFNRDEKRTRRRRLAETVRFILEIRRRKYDLVVDCRSNLSTLVFTYTSGAPHKVGFDIGGRGFSLTAKVAANTDLHEIDRNLSLAAAVGASTGDRSPEIHFRPEDKRHAAALLGRGGIGDQGPLVAVHAGAPWRPRRWDTEKFAEVIDWVLKDLGGRVALVGGGRDRRRSDRVLGLVDGTGGGIIDCVGKTTFGQTAAILAGCDLFLGVDSAPMHIAAAVGTPVVCLMGPGEYPRFAPYGTENVVIRKDVGCSPCRQDRNRQTCAMGENVCMKGIGADEVKHAAARLLGRRVRT